MADITTQAIPASVQVPGHANSRAYVYFLTLVSSSDTMKVPRLRTRSATADQSSVRVLAPATNVTVTAAAEDANGEHTITFGGSSAAEGVKVTLVALLAHGAPGSLRA